MSKGNVFSTPITRFKDARTGREVWKVSGFDDFHCVGTYMYMQPFACGERYVVFASNRTGRYELYRMDLTTEQTTQMTSYPMAKPDEGADVLFWVNMSPDDREVLFKEAGSLRAMDVRTLAERVVFTIDGQTYDPTPAMPNLSADGRTLLLGCNRVAGGQAILEVDVASGSLNRLHQVGSAESKYVSHVLGATHAGRPIMTYVLDPDRQNKPDLSRAERARSWKLDPATGKTEPFLVMPPGFRATHDYWNGPNRSRLYYHKKTVPTWVPASIESIASDGTDLRVHFTCDRKLGHSCLSPDGRWIVSDVQDATGNELYLIDVNTGNAEILCWPDSSLRDGQLGHVHPGFSPSGRFVFYTSDKSGKAAMFLVPV